MGGLFKNVLAFVNLLTIDSMRVVVTVASFLFLIGFGVCAAAGAASGDDGTGCSEKGLTVQGTSMQPRIMDGARVDVQIGGPACIGRISSGEILLFSTAASPIPLIKTVRGVPGDRLAMQGSHVFINGVMLANTQKQPYHLSAAREQMLALYAKDYGVIPPDTFLLMGEQISGTTDSTVFGLVPRNQIIGKVVERPNEAAGEHP